MLRLFFAYPTLGWGFWRQLVSFIIRIDDLPAVGSLAADRTQYVSQK
jgi:hypothetical protein